MKKIYFIFVSLTLVLLSFSSCERDSIDQLEGLYTPPGISDATNVESVSKTTDNAGLRHFTIRLTGGKDNIIFELIGGEYYLQAATFSPGVNSSATVNTYSLENSSCNGSKIIKGPVSVVTEDNRNYEVSGVVWTADGDIVKFCADGIMEYEPDKIVVDPIIGQGTVETSPLYGNDANGNWGPVEGCYEHLLTVMDGDTHLALFDIYSDNESSISGTYTVADGRAEAGIMNNGWIWGESSGGTVLYINDTAYMVKSGEVTVEETETDIVVTCYGATTQDADGNLGPVNFIYQIKKQ